MPRAIVNGQTIAFEDTNGDKPAVVLAHGFLMDRDMFVHQVETLRADYRVVTWDQRGFGETVYDGRPFTFWDSARDCLALMDLLGIESAVVGGMSQGGFVSLRVALLAPRRVRALVLLDTEAGVFSAAERADNDAMNDRWSAEGPVEDLVDAIAEHIIAEPGQSRHWVAKWRARPKESFALPYACLAGRDDVTARLDEISCPALVVHGMGDRAIDMSRAEILADGLKGAGSVVRVRGAHAACLTNPKPVNAALREFLAAVHAS